MSELTKMKNIILADDDADDRMLFEDALNKINSPTRLTALNDGHQLMDVLDTVQSPPPPDIIFLDLNMPGKNGFECLHEIRNTPRLSRIPVVMFTTSSNRDSVDKTYSQGANLYLCKPRSFPLLVKAIETVLSMDMWEQPQASKEDYVLKIA